MKESDKRRTSSNNQSKRSGKSERRLNQTTKGVESKSLHAKTDSSDTILVSDSNTGSEPSEVYDNLVIHYVDDVNRSEKPPQDSKADSMVTRGNKGDALDDLSGDLDREAKEGKEDESDSETTLDSVSSHGDSVTADGEKVENVLIVPKTVSSKNLLDSGPPRGSRMRSDRNNNISKSKAVNSTPKKPAKTNKGPLKATSKSSFDKNSKDTRVPPKPSLESSEGVDDKPAEDVKEIDDASNGTQSVASDNETVDAEENGEHEDEAELNQKIEDMEMRIGKLEAELREVAALEISLYSVVPEHGSSAHKVHTPARRLSRLYIHACKHWTQVKRATVAKNTVSGLVLISKSCGNDVPRLTFWLSNTILLREIISQAFGSSRHASPLARLAESNGGSKKGEGKPTQLKWKGGSGSKQVNGFMQIDDDWQETGTFTAALERVESWIFSRVVESVWWQALTPHMHSPTGDLSSNKTTGRLLGPALGDQQQGSFSINLWKNAFQDALQRLCPVRAGGHECMNLQLPYCFCFFLLLQLPFSTIGQAYKNVSLGTSLTAASGDLPWTSPSGDFAFGFQQVGDAGYLLAIWFNKIPERTIVWSANRNKLAQRGSRVQLTADGQLVLNDQSGTQIWTTRYLGGSGAAYGAMLDTGNFVLAGQAGANLWQSFDEPTDTLLPTQNLNSAAQLIAPYLEKNYSDGRFKLILQGDGNLVLYTTAYPFTTPNFAYWSTGIGSANQLIFNQSGDMYLVASNGTILNRVFSNSVPLQDLYLRATIDYDGVFRQYVYPKTASGGKRWAMNWTTFPNSIPSNICLAIRYSAGSGACGFNSYCRSGDDQRPSCRCPPGYTFVDQDDEWKGCKKTFISQDCDHPSQETDSFEIRDMLNTNFPYADYEFFGSVGEDWCRQSCLSDCYCDVASFKDGRCWKKRGPLLNGVTDPSIGDKALMKVRKGNWTAGSSAKKRDPSALIITGSVLSGSSIFLIVLSLLGIYVFFTRWNRQKQKLIPQHHVMRDMNLQNFTYNELETATGGFDEELGRGAFGPVYKGVLGGEDKQIIAVKKLEKMAGEGETEFKTEVKVIGRTNHKNLVQLVGFCNEGQHRLLVYEYMSSGSLSNYIFGDSRPNWHRRMQIAFGVARGLLYLHEECSSQIIHCDIKPQNILLDESFNARISDFGLAKLLKTEQSKTTTAIRGTKGYVAPEWFKNLPVTAKVDTYSFGILLLELVCCRKNFEIDAREEHQIVLADWACDCFREGKLSLLVEEDEEAMEDMKRVERFVMVAIWCIQEDPSLRPAMKKVVQMLEGGVQVSVPPDPSSFISSI